MPLDLKALHEERQNRAAAKRKRGHKEEEQRPSSSPILVSDNDDDDDGDDHHHRSSHNVHSVASDMVAADAAMAARLQSEYNAPHRTSSSDAALAALLQQQFNDDAGGGGGGGSAGGGSASAPASSADGDALLASMLQEQEVGRAAMQYQRIAPDGREGSDYLKWLSKQMDATRMSCEGPPDAVPVVTQDRDGTQQRCKPAARPWSDAQPCVSCDDAACLGQLRELGVGEIATQLPSKQATHGGGSSGGGAAAPFIAKHPANITLLRFLCSWRQHVKETFLETKKAGSAKWSKCSICTSELTFLGRKYAKGGVIGCVALATAPIDSIPALFSLEKQQQPNGSHPLKALSAMIAMFIALKFHWSWTADAKALFIAKVAKLSETQKPTAAAAGGGGGAKKTTRGAAVWKGSPVGLAYDHIQAGTAVPSLLRHSILSRGHLP